jgi:hypothetical protein
MSDQFWLLGHLQQQNWTCFFTPHYEDEFLLPQKGENNNVPRASFIMKEGMGIKADGLHCGEGGVIWQTTCNIF